MKEEKRQKLISAVENFVNGNDRSIAAANEIEGLLAELFPEDEMFDDVMIALASYRPGGGDYLYDEVRMTDILIKIRALLG